MSVFKLTSDQVAVVTASADQRTLVQAGPGAGKTEVVARRLAHLVGTCALRPSQILVLSFSRSAVKALIGRIRSLDNADSAVIEDLRFLSVRTFDSWTFRMLRFLGHEASTLLQNDYAGNIKLFLDELDNVREESNPRLSVIRHFIVDEYQDLAGIRATLVQRLLEILTAEGNECGFTVLGDPDQAIYDWSLEEHQDEIGRTSRALVDWIKSTFGTTLLLKRLAVNHRADPGLAKLVERASKLLRSCEKNDKDPVDGLRALILKAAEKTGVDEIFDILASEPADKGMAVLCRSNSQILQLATLVQYLAFKKNRTIAGLRLAAGNPPRTLPSWIAKLLYQYKTKQITKSNFIKVFGRVFPPQVPNPPCSGDAAAAWRLLLGYARHGEEDTSLDMDELRIRIVWPESLPDDESELDDIVRLTTIHQSKGLEFRTVRIIHDDSASGDGDSHEEGRVLFVGMSRARESLALLELNDKRPFYPKTSNDGRTRWHRWIFGQQQLELGCDGDVNQESIVRGDLMGGSEVVKETQKFLADREKELIGSRVTLEKTQVPGQPENRFHYRITLEWEGKIWCLGFLEQFVTRDLLSLRSKNKPLPGRIYNLRVGAVTTSVGRAAPHHDVPSPWCESRFWLSVCIHGVGQCNIY